MNDKKISESEIQEDSLDQTAYEIVKITDTDLAMQFLKHNNDALYNPKAILTNTDIYDEEINVELGINEIDEKLRKETIAKLRNSKTIVKQLLSENYKKEFWLKNWKKIKSFFVKDSYVYQENFTYRFETHDWKAYNQFKLKRKRQNEVVNNDFLTYTDLQLRDQKKLKKIWTSEIGLSLFGWGLAIAFMVLISVLVQGFTGASSAILESLNNYKIAIYTFSIFAIISIIIPYFFLITSWFVGINEVHKSKYFHYFMIIFLVVTYLFLLIATGLIIAYFSYSWNLWIPT